MASSPRLHSNERKIGVSVRNGLVKKHDLLRSESPKVSSSRLSSASYVTAVDYRKNNVGCQMSSYVGFMNSPEIMNGDCSQKEATNCLKKCHRSNKEQIGNFSPSRSVKIQIHESLKTAPRDPNLVNVINDSIAMGIELLVGDSNNRNSGGRFSQPGKFVSGHFENGRGRRSDQLVYEPSVSHYESPPVSLYNGTHYTEAKDSFAAIEISDCASSVGKSSGSGKVSNSFDFVESGKSSICRGSTASDVSEESSSSSLSSAVNKPHKGSDPRWEAIQAIRSRDGMLGLNHFRLLKRLGRGDIGTVHLVELCHTRSYFAMKVMDKAALESRKKLQRSHTEREILQCLDHPFLPTLYAHFETEGFSCLLMEFCPGGDLHALRQKQVGKHFSEQAARFYVAEVLLALEYLHMLGIVYRDLKPENVLVREDGHIMLSDFDLSLRCVVSPTMVKSSSSEMDGLKNSGYCIQPACVEPGCVIQPSCMQATCFSPRFLSGKSKKERKDKQKNGDYNQGNTLPELMAEPTNARSMSFVGTHEYLAPEIIKGEGHGSAVDWWTFGIFLYELLFGRTPFKGPGNRATLCNVIGQPLRFPESPMVSFAARDLIRGLLVKEPQHRLAYRRGATEIKQHPFFQNVNWALIRCTNPPDVPKPILHDILATELAAAKNVNVPGGNLKPSGNYLEIDFF
ncbi:hypothetical protein Scep_021201 [Stephania cephalantha]|uniref:non-specific serine/threonine protein kinase n=1 Tax=Stephania cephalantha TaxID=152367 RepID=A0AAP0F8J9_9MAGN